MELIQVKTRTQGFCPSLLLGQPNTFPGTLTGNTKTNALMCNADILCSNLMHYTTVTIPLLYNFEHPHNHLNSVLGNCNSPSICSRILKHFYVPLRWHIALHFLFVLVYIFFMYVAETLFLVLKVAFVDYSLTGIFRYWFSILL